MIVVDDYDITYGTGQTYDTDEYAVVTTSGGQGIAGLGTFYTGISTNNVVAGGDSVLFASSADKYALVLASSFNHCSGIFLGTGKFLLM